MMYIAGETQETSLETLALVENIIRDQVLLMITTANDLAVRRGSGAFSNNDIIFQFRHDTPRIARLRTFLGWKSIRKTIKDDDDKDAGRVDMATFQDSAFDKTIDGTVQETLTRTIKPPTITLPWDLPSFFSETIPYEDQDELCRSNEDALQRLRRADEATKDMTTEEYVTWSEYRHASFTWRRTKRFREWSGLGVIADHKPTDDVLDILGFLTCEMVQALTELALEIQEQEQRWKRNGEVCTSPCKKPTGGIFTPSARTRLPIEPQHVRQAFGRLQAGKRSRVMLDSTLRNKQTKTI
ncbi:hypothetical protein IG631_23328 [Alternaria alternata]|nr:hypothetical protein IG631_23328 [Alternaria alternata]